jgi:S1-C subfamily serine protease
MKKIAYIFCIAMLFSSCTTIDRTTTPNFSDYQLCDFLTLNWITTSSERMAVANELSRRNLTCTGGVPISKNANIETIESPPSVVPQPSIKQQLVAGGTGFLFSSKDYVITNWHVVKGASSIVAKFINGQTVEAVVVAKDLKNDIAILKLANASPLSATSIKLGDSSAARMGEKIFTIGYPAFKIMGEKPKYSEGVINAVTGLKDDPAFFQVSVPIQPGNSGGPLFNERGEVIGMTTASLSPLASDAMGAIPQNVNYAIKSSFVKNLLSTIPDLMLSNTNIVVVPKESGNSLPNFIEQVSKNIVLIETKE